MTDSGTTQKPYLRFPSLHGDTIAFAAEDDVWLAPLEGGRAWRVTADNSPVSDVRFSPDGANVAYLGRRDGAGDVYVVPTGGGQSRRITWWGDELANVAGWTDDDRVIGISAVGEPFRSRSWARAVPLDGGPAERLPYGPVTGVAHGPDGGVVLSTGNGGRRRDYAWWKRYRGGTASRLWIDRAGSGRFERLGADLDGQLVTPMWVGDRIAFLSDHEGVGNVYSCLPDGSDLRRHTDQTDFYARQATTDGSRIVFVVAGDIWLLEDLAADSKARQVDVLTGGPAVGRTATPINAAKHLGDISVDETGRASAIEVRGTVHWLTHRDGPVRTLTAEAGVRARSPRLLHTFDEAGQVAEPRVAWVSDATGEDALVVADADGNQRTLAAGRLGRVLELAGAPDGSAIAVATDDGRLLLVDAASGEDRLLARTENDAVRDLAFSPDSAWLAWTHPGPLPLAQIKLARLGDGEVFDATPLRFTDTEPVFTPDGRYLAFLSRRTFDPVYDEFVFDLSFPASTRPHLIPLARVTPSPFDPRREGRPAAPAQPASNAAEGSGAQGEQPGRTAPQVTIDLDGLAERVVPVPVQAGRYSSLQAVADGLVWLHEPLRGETGDDQARPGGEPPRPTLERVDFAHGRLTVLSENVDAVEVSGDGRRLVIRDGESLRVVPSDRPVKPDEEDPDARVEVDLGRVRVVVDPPAEWRQMYDENGRLMRDNFWVPDMAGVDWDGVLDRYRPLLDRIASRDDLSDLIWEVIGELGTSHAYEVPSPRPVEASRRLGRLGADLEREGAAGGTPDGDGARWRITRVLPGESSSGQGRSPLRAPGVDVNDGDYLVAVDGQPVDPVTGPGPLLVGTAGVPVELLVEPADGGERRHVVVVPLDDDMPLRYHAWVAERRSAVHSATDGRVGYLHVPDMIATGWAQLHRDLRTEMRRDGLVLDVRDNRGGHTSQLVVEKLARKVIGWGLGRGWEPETYPNDARRGPMVCLTDENAGSDGDIVTAAVKDLGLGPVIGMRTWGGVIGIDMRYTLVDGTSVTQPRYAFWFDSVGWGVENHGVDPDIEVPLPPHDWAAGRDPQMDTALEVVQQALAEQPVATPPSTDSRPSRVPPSLPPRP